ncbi:VRR-NUC domain-containing protein [Hymenobacter weizhouensis]|uniref:VRR-NUC domain-containing protein n=1 Tax=Hymenobacter sp. YIM 151500-1 TaxID=2987689 RepID=UPI002227C23D|nr:VRR-NUC domain-containing protein [Hymenobacter sp. YIM 151500-1]UYZ64899.1 VRR-NUC domain-containing protein [Hymenobacter sp. YIM 151500-1]
MNRRKAPAKPQAQTPLDFGTLTAEQITAAILGYLEAHGFTAWAQPNRGEYDPKTGRWRPHPNSRRGVPDILGFRRADGRFLGIEVKAGTDRLRPEQMTFLRELKAAGGLAFVAYDFAGFVQSFERRGLHVVATTATHDAAPAPPYPTSPPTPAATDDPQPAYACRP